MIKYESRRKEAFIKDLIALYDKHQIAISHEDNNGSFILKPVTQDLKDWMEDARIEGID